MIEFIAKYAIVLIPLIIFLITIGMKMSIGKALHEITWGHTILEIPIDLLFISLALTITYVSKNQSALIPGVVLMLGELFFSFVSVLLWRYSAKCLLNEKLIRCAIIGFINYNITIWTLIYIINLNTL